VAQYAERARITAYFPLGTVSDQGKDKTIWLWAALSERGVDHDFDSLRIFTWSTRKHRYETSFIERGLKGHLPVHVVTGPGGAATGFKVVVQEKTGAVVEREYALQGFRARVVARKESGYPPSWLPEKKQPVPPGAETTAPTPGWRERTSGWLEAVKKKLKR